MTWTDESHIVRGDERPRVYLTREGKIAIAVVGFVIAWVSSAITLLTVITEALR